MTKKSIAIYIETEHLQRLDLLRGVTDGNPDGAVNRSVAINRILGYILKQSDQWCVDLIVPTPT